MKISLSKNVKYGGKPHKIGETIEIDSADLKSFEKAEAVKEVVEEDDEKDIEQMNEKELKALAKQKKIEGYTTMKKEELIAALKE